MAGSKSERLLNLLIMLLVQRHFVPKQRIRSLLYPDTGHEAFEKMFERDKEELRALGVPIEVGSVDALFEEPGYRVRPEALSHSEVHLEPDEAAILAVAGRAWQDARMSGATTDALRKLAAVGVDVDSHSLELAMPRLVVDEATFETFWLACQERQPLTFDYRRPGLEPTRRHLHPWGVVRSSGRWYVVGHDTDRGARRIFRLSRVVGEPAPDGPAGSYEVPPDVDIGEVARSLAPRRRTDDARLLVRPGRGHGLRHRGTVLESGVTGPDGQPWDLLQVTGHHEHLIDEVLGHGADVVVVAPDEVRTAVVSRLRALVPGGTR